MKVKKIFRASRGRINTTHLYALPVPQLIASYGPAPCTISTPPFNISRSAPDHMQNFS